MKRNYSKDEVKVPRKIGIIHQAAELRDGLFGQNEAVDPEHALDSLCEQICGFDWFVGDCFFDGMTDVVAFAKFDNGRQVFISESVYEDLGKYQTDKYRRAAFVVAHEIGHAVLHHRTRKGFARHKLGSEENYRVEVKREKEANIFAGSFLIPTTKIDPALSDYTLSRVYQTSYQVAGYSKKEAQLYRKWLHRK